MYKFIAYFLNNFSNSIARNTAIPMAGAIARFIPLKD
jgi:hypothetical protein